MAQWLMFDGENRLGEFIIRGGGVSLLLK